MTFLDAMMIQIQQGGVDSTGTLIIIRWLPLSSQAPWACVVVMEPGILGRRLEGLGGGSFLGIFEVGGCNSKLEFNGAGDGIHVSATPKILTCSIQINSWCS